MAQGGGGNAFLGFILGALVMFVALVFVFGWSGSERIMKVELPQFDRTR